MFFSCSLAPHITHLSVPNSPSPRHVPAALKKQGIDPCWRDFCTKHCIIKHTKINVQHTLPRVTNRGLVQTRVSSKVSGVASCIAVQQYVVYCTYTAYCRQAHLPHCRWRALVPRNFDLELAPTLTSRGNHKKTSTSVTQEVEKHRCISEYDTHDGRLSTVYI